jgi:CRISPR-associated protein Csd1
MSWLLNLYETYQANEHKFVGKIETKRNGQTFTLLPISHTTQNAHVEVTITEDGEFLSAFVIEDKNEMNTLIPCTESAASRSGTVIAPYPLHDKLAYVAGDFADYGGEVKKELPFDTYIQELANWANSAHGHPKVRSIYNYLRKGHLIRDLVQAGVLCVDENNRLAERWDAKLEALYKEKPKIFSVVPTDQFSTFVRFTVYSPDGASVKVWNDPEVYESFIRYYNERLEDYDLCYVTGQRLPSSERHANKIRNPADKAKLISANDTSGFTFRGRFNESREAASISYEVSQKAHNALKWLINRQAKIVDGRVFLVWGNESVDMPAPDDDYYDFQFLRDDAIDDVPLTRKTHAQEFAKAMDGYKNRLIELSGNGSRNVNILILDSATTGRMGVLYYRNMDIDLYFERLIHWHTTCVWLHKYRRNEQQALIAFFGAPATKDIAYAAYGSKADDKVVKGLMERLLPCILDKRPIPKDIVSCAMQRASNPVSMERWEWEKTLSIACALINKNEKEGFDVALDTKNTDRSYLFGRLLAIADVLERNALGPEEQRATNAIRYMNAFSRHPARTWKTIQESLQPYQAKLGTRARYLSAIIDEVGSMIAPADFNNAPLTGLYLLGFYSQRHDLYQKKDKTQPDDNSDPSGEQSQE